MTTIADTSGSFLRLSSNPAINDAGTVAFVALLDTGDSALFTGSGGGLTLIADTSGPFGAFRTFPGGGLATVAPAINDQGTVAFFATLDAGGSGIFTGDGTGITTVADTSGPFSGFAQTVPGLTIPAINNLGTVAFLATLDAGGSGIFTGPDPVADRVIATGDPLFGSTVVSLGFFREALNDAGQVAFTATLADGRFVIVRADPAGLTVPEPSSLALLCLGALGLLVYRRLRGNRHLP